MARFRRNGNVGDHYLGLIEVQQTDAKSLMEQKEIIFIAKGVKVENTTFGGFDDCNTMSGAEQR